MTYEQPLEGVQARLAALAALNTLAPDNKAQQIAMLLEARKAVILRNMIRNFRPTPKQQEFFSMGNRRTRRAFFGGNRTGKTVCGAAEVSYHVTGRYPDGWDGVRFDAPPLTWAAGTSLEKTVDGVQTMLLGPPGHIGTGFIPGHRIVDTQRGTIPNSIGKAWIRWGEGNETACIVFKSFDQGRQKFESVQVQLIWLDEEPPKDVHDECKVRLLGSRSSSGRVKRGGQMILTFSPLQGMTDVCKIFLRPDMTDESEELKGGNGVVIASWADNTYLLEDEVEELRRSTPEHEREAREHGRPVLGAGMIYPIAEKIYSIPFFEIPKNAGWKFAIGLDHGWDHPAGLTFWAQDPNSGVCYLYRTWRSKQTLIPVMAQIIKEEYQRLGGWVPVFADPSGVAERQDNGGKSIFQQYAECGVNLIEADNQFEAGTIEMFTGLQSGSIRVFEGAPCIHFWEEVRLYQKNEKGKVLKQDDDVMDASRYPIRHRTQWVTPRHMESQRSKDRRSRAGHGNWKTAR